MTTSIAPYRIVADDSDGDQRLIAVTADDVVICGAYRPARLNDWRVYLTKSISDRTGLPQPQKVHVVSRDDAVRWLDTIAVLYTAARS